MKHRHHRPGLQTLVLMLCLIGIGGTVSLAAPQGAPDAAELRKELGPVPLPDLAEMEAPFIEQLEAARADFEAIIVEPDASAQRLAAAYGTLGQLYHAYELVDPAAACYANATVLEPRDFRWQHLLGDVTRAQGDLEAAASHFEAAWTLEARDFAALVYLGDSAPDDGLVDLARGADVLIAHSAVADDEQSLVHMGPAQAGELAARADVGCLVLSHFYRRSDPDRAVDSAARSFAGRIVAAEDGMTLDVAARGGR